MLPKVRRLAEQLGVDPAQLTGTGPGGRITEEDLRGPTPVGASPPPTAGAAGPERRVKMSPTRKAIADNLARSWREIPHVTTYAEADAEPLLDARAAAGKPRSRPCSSPVSCRCCSGSPTSTPPSKATRSFIGSATTSAWRSTPRTACWWWWSTGPTGATSPGWARKSCVLPRLPGSGRRSPTSCAARFSRSPTSAPSGAARDAHCPLRHHGDPVGGSGRPGSGRAATGRSWSDARCR